MDRPFESLKAFVTIAMIVFYVASTVSAGGEIQALALDDLSVSQLESQVAEIDMLIATLATPSMRAGVGSVGYRSEPTPDPEASEWVRIDLAQPADIDEIVLVPTIWRDTKAGFGADGFPIAFRVTVGNLDAPGGKVIAEYTAEDELLPRVAPLSIPCSEIGVEWVRIDATELSTRNWDGQRILQLSEVAVFSGSENAALGQPVTVSSENGKVDTARNKRFLVDGFVPYLMDARQGTQSIAYVTEVDGNEPAVISIDLGEIHTLDHIHLHATDVSDTVPQAVASDFGIPRLMTIEGSLKADFSDAVPLMRYEMKSVLDTGPIIMRECPPTRCRYVRLTAIEPYIDPVRIGKLHLGFAEIELISKGINVALNRPVSVTTGSIIWSRDPSTVTDGNNFYGQILPIREWLGQLVLRHELERRRPKIATEIRVRYLRQQSNINQLIILTAFLAFAGVVAVLFGWFMRQRAIVNMREQFAADLHDELGANIHAIGLLTDMAQTASESPAKLRSLMTRMRELTQRTGSAAAYCANLLESKGLYDDLTADMRRTSARIMADLEHELVFEGDEHLRRLPARKRIDLFLFHKECLINIIRHSGASRATTHVHATATETCMTITDDGCGLAASQGAEKIRNGLPPSLKRRARLLGGTVSADSPEHGGTRVTLKTKRSRFARIKL